MEQNEYTIVTPAIRSAIKLNQPACLWFTGLSGSGKSTLSNAVELRLIREFQAHTFVLDGDVIRAGLSRDLGFSLAERTENIRRIAEVSRLFVDAGLIVLTAFISPLRVDRNHARQLIHPGQFIEIYVECSLKLCEQRDPKDLYKKARSGTITDFTGINSPYEEPIDPELILHTEQDPVTVSTQKVINYLKKRSILVDVMSVRS